MTPCPLDVRDRVASPLRITRVAHRARELLLTRLGAQAELAHSTTDELSIRKALRVLSHGGDSSTPRVLNDHALEDLWQFTRDSLLSSLGMATPLEPNAGLVILRRGRAFEADAAEWRHGVLHAVGRFRDRHGPNFSLVRHTPPVDAKPIARSWPREQVREVRWAAREKAA